MDRLHQWAIGAAGASVAAVLTALALHGWKAWAAMAVVCIAAPLVVVFVLRARQTFPRLVIETPLIRDQPNPGLIVGFPGRQAYLHVSNRPRGGGNPAERVYVTLRCIRESDRTVIWDWGEIYARWSYLPKETRIEETLTARFVTIYPSDPPHRIDVAIKIEGVDSLGQENAIYIISDNTSHSGLQKPLGHEPILIDVRAQGTAFGQRLLCQRRFRLQDLPNSDLSLSPIEMTK